MSTLAEIEEAVATLPRPEQETLLQHLAQRLARPSTKPVAQDMDPERRRKWLEELAEIRERNGRGRLPSTPLQQILDEIREDRC